MSFYQMLSRYYDVLFPSNQSQIHFIQSVARDRKCLLDVAAGTGNQAFALAQLGYEVTAVDVDPDMIERIRQKNAIHPIIKKAMELDMREIGELPANSFDAVLCIGNSIAHLSTLEEIEACLQRMHTILRENGVVIVQTVNYDRILQQQIKELPILKRPEHQLEFHRSYEPYQGKLKFHGKLILDQSGEIETLTNCVELYPIRSTEMHAALSSAGFTNIELFGDYSGESFHVEAPALIAVAYKLGASN